ncbi:hypothetical protein OEB99_16640 [Actinotalea sp. M2MS4P-6]|uniref:hypothetical protein n=1 Tax=Actinotalea sp. M2MS4P-6 TaxID=2983762 RepID=UPI0021E475A4|nr:hypothetical protein [Actinotalea sp. M2MS4P-6]MCV2395945.1 hypothetical protein [Actinotalea sp. M2MS4P-6]
MATPEQIQVIAASINAHHPDWPVNSLVTFLGRNHGHRSYRVLSIAAIVVATDPTTTTPALLNNPGAWWAAAATAIPSEAATSVPSAATERCPVDGHEHEIAGHCRACESERKGAAGWLEPEPVPAPTAESYARGAALVREALAKARADWTPTIAAESSDPHQPDAAMRAAHDVEEDL